MPETLWFVQIVLIFRTIFTFHMNDLHGTCNCENCRISLHVEIFGHHHIMNNDAIRKHSTIINNREKGGGANSIYVMFKKRAIHTCILGKINVSN